MLRTGLPPSEEYATTVHSVRFSPSSRLIDSTNSECEGCESLPCATTSDLPARSYDSLWARIRWISGSNADHVYRRRAIRNVAKGSFLASFDQAAPLAVTLHRRASMGRAHTLTLHHGSTIIDVRAADAQPCLLPAERRLVSRACSLQFFERIGRLD
jgi:hypothetical protein